MQLLRFRFENHKSFGGPSELSMVQARLKTAGPGEGAVWADYTWRIAAIYGPNGSGKSSALEALNFMIDIVRHSATRWTEMKSLPHFPFALDDGSAARSTSFVIDFVADEIRYEYGFSFSRSQIHTEFLYDYPSGRRRLLFERDTELAQPYRFGRALTGGIGALQKITGPRELLLSRAGTSHHETLRPLFKQLDLGIQFARLGELDRSKRLQRVVEGLATGEIAVTDLITLLQVADVGIEGVEVETREVPESVRRILENLTKSVEREPRSEVAADSGVEVSVIDGVSKGLRFQHSGRGGRAYPLGATQQSAGTLSWLALAVPSLETLRSGGVLMIDEIDASLHPQLAQILINIFEDTDFNALNAQLIFTTHDTYFLSPTSEINLDPEEIWLVQKNREGLSELYSLADFAPRGDQNHSRRYLHGRYGAVPAVAPSFIHRLLDKPASSPA